MLTDGRLNILTFARLQALLFGLIGMLLGVLYSFGGFLIDALVTLEFLSPEAMGTPGLSMGTALAFGALVGMPLIGLVLGFVTGLLEAVLFNFCGGWIGFKG